MIKRKSLRSQIIDAIWQLILDGEIAPNDPLREVHLASLLNISRTPLREALQKLEWEGIVTSELGKGFRLSKFSEEEINEIYPLRAKLESYAFELSGIPSEEIIEKLISTNLKMVKTSSPKKLIELDEFWHDLLIFNCTNRTLLKMIKILRRQSQRYEYAYMNNRNEVKVSIAQHEKIIIHLKDKNMNEASKLLAENLVVGIDTLINWLKYKNNNTM